MFTPAHLVYTGSYSDKSILVIKFNKEGVVSEFKIRNSKSHDAFFMGKSLDKD